VKLSFLLQSCKALQASSWLRAQGSRLKLAQGSSWLKVQGSSWLKAQVGSRFKAQGSRSKTTWQLNCFCFDDQNGYKYVAAGPKLEFSDTKFLTPNLKQLKQFLFLINAWNKQIGINDVFFRFVEDQNCDCQMLC